MEICAVIIWYNPNEKMWENVSKYLPFVEGCIIIDNSKKNNKKLIQSKSKKLIYIPNQNNLGIAKALNRGCEIANKLGFKWALTMDQDSSFKKKDYKKYLIRIKEILKKDHSAVSFSPNYNISRKKGFGKVKSVITSGNIILLSSWEKVGKFDNKLFINEVDTIFCYNLLKENYKIYQIYGAKMNHNVFDKYLHIKLFGKNYYIRQDDSPLAKYYITRNSFEKNRLFPKITENKNFLIKLIIKIIFFEYKKIKKLKMVWEGYKDYKKRKFGKYLF